MCKILKRAVVVLGPDIKREGRNNPTLLKAHLEAIGLEVAMIGDGVKDITLSQVKTELLSSDKPTILFMNLHGARPATKEAERREMEERMERQYDVIIEKSDGKINPRTMSFEEMTAAMDGLEPIKATAIVIELMKLNYESQLADKNENDVEKKLDLQFNDKNDVFLRDIFDITKNMDHVDVFLSTCYGAFGHEIAQEYLKPGEHFIATGIKERHIFLYDFHSYNMTLPQAKKHYEGGVTAKKIYHDFCATDYFSNKNEKNPSTPIITSSEGTFNPEKELLIGKAFTEKQKKLVFDGLQSLVKKDRLSTIMAHLETCTSLEMVNKDYLGTAFSISHILK